MSKRLITTILITIALAGAFNTGITLYSARQANIPDPSRFQAVAGMLILTTLGCIIGIIISASLYRLIGKANGPKWAKTFLSITVSLFLVLVTVKAIGHPVVCPVLISIFSWSTCSGGDCCFPEIGTAMWAGITAMLFGSGLGQR